MVADNTLDRQLEVAAPDTVWVTDITYIRTQEGCSYLSVVIDLFSGRVVGWSMQSRMTTDLALQALLSAIWRRKPKHRALIHSDQEFLRIEKLSDARTSLFWAGISIRL